MTAVGLKKAMKKILEFLVSYRLQELSVRIKRTINITV